MSGHPPCEQSERAANAAQPEQSEPVANAAQPGQSEPVANAAQPEQSEPVADELNEPVAEQRAAKARSKNKGGGKRNDLLCLANLVKGGRCKWSGAMATSASNMRMK